MNLTKTIIHELLRLKIRMIFSKKIRKIKRNLPKEKFRILDNKIIKEHKNLWKPIWNRVNSNWLKCYTAITGVQSFLYTPEDIYYSELEPRLNFKPYSKAFTDKNLYDLTIEGVNLPGVVLRNIEGVFYDYNYDHLMPEDLDGYLTNLTGKKLIIKETIDTGGGKGVRMIDWMDGGIKLDPVIPDVHSLKDLLDKYASNYLIQEYIDQHPFFSRFNPSSLNTIRILTYRSVSDETIHILHKILRVGAPGKIVDNQASGGKVIGIDNKNRLRSRAIIKSGKLFKEINGIELNKIGEVPYIKEVTEVAVKVARQYLYSRILGLDLTITSAGEPVLIEVNDINNEINFYQMTNGPLFGEFTKEIIQYCQSKSKSIMFDFQV